MASNVKLGQAMKKTTEVIKINNLDFKTINLKERTIYRIWPR